MLLTRLLAPEAFGTLAIVTSATSVLISLTDVGAKEALIQNPRGTEDSYVGAAWWLTVGRALSLYSILFLVAPLISGFYRNGQLTALMRVASASLLFEGLMSSQAYVAIKKMKFQKWAAISHGGGIAGVLITVILSFFIRNVWALVLGTVAESAARCFLSYVLCPFLPSLKLDKAAIRELLRFSRGVFGLAILNLIFIRTDIFVLGKLYSPAQLGVYAMAIYLVQTPVTFIINLLGQTLMSTFSHIQADAQRINRILLQVMAVIFLLGMPMVVFMFFCARPLLGLVYGQAYAAASSALVVAAFVAILNVANAQITTVFYAKGLPQLHRRCVVIMAILMILLIYPFAKQFGLVGGQLACLISIIAGYSFQIERIRKITQLNLARYWRISLVSGIISLCAIAFFLFAKAVGSLSRPIPILLSGVTACLVAYGLGFAIILRDRKSQTESALGL
jgi:O-antigen/teichoic acid export membrane protein